MSLLVVAQRCNKVDAISHLEQFRNDDSGLFRQIEVIDNCTHHQPYSVLEFQSADCFVSIYN